MTDHRAEGEHIKSSEHPPADVEEAWPYPNFTLDDIDERVLLNDDISIPLTDAILEATKRARAYLSKRTRREKYDWPKILQRYGTIHERISTYPDEGDPTPDLLRLCELRDGILGAARANDPDKMLAALEATNTIPGRAPDTRREKMEEALQRFVDHYPSGINPDLDEAYSLARASLESPQ